MGHAIASDDTPAEESSSEVALGENESYASDFGATLPAELAIMNHRIQQYGKPAPK